MTFNNPKIYTFIIKEEILKPIKTDLIGFNPDCSLAFQPAGRSPEEITGSKGEVYFSISSSQLLFLRLNFHFNPIGNYLLYRNYPGKNGITYLKINSPVTGQSISFSCEVEAVKTVFPIIPGLFINVLSLGIINLHGNRMAIRKCFLFITGNYP